MTSRAKTLVSVIYVGSTYCELMIFQKKQGRFRVFERAVTPMDIGQQSFHNGKLSFETIYLLCDVIQKYITLSSEYGVDSFHLIATTAVREAANRDFIVDQIRVQTGKRLIVLDDTTEKQYIYKALKIKYLDALPVSNEVTFLTYFGTGSLGTGIMENGLIRVINTIDLGYIKMHSMLEALQDYSKRFYAVLEDYVNIYTKPLRQTLSHQKIDRLLAAGFDIELIAKLCHCEQDAYGKYELSREEFLAMYHHVKHLTTSQIAVEYQLSDRVTHTLLYSLVLYYNLIFLTKAEKISLVPCSIGDSFIEVTAMSLEVEKKLRAWERKCVLLSARSIAEKYRCGLEHGETVRSYSIEIFNRMTQFHGLKSGDLLLLECAALLHECGKFAKIRDYYALSYELIKCSEIFGLTPQQLHLIACIAESNRTLAPMANPLDYTAQLTHRERMTVAKLTAIIKIAEALDKSYSNKAIRFKAKLSHNVLYFHIVTKQNYKLEEWAYYDRIGYFEEVYGIRPVLKIEKVV